MTPPDPALQDCCFGNWKARSFSSWHLPLLSSLVLQLWLDAAIVLAIVVGSALLSFFQEYRASRAVEELKGSLALMSRVVRDGEWSKRCRSARSAW